VLTNAEIATISLVAEARKREELAPEISSQRRLGNALFYGIVALLAYLVYLVFAPFLVALAWAVVLVVVSYPAYQWLARRWGRTGGAAAATIGITLILIVPAILIAGAFIRQGVQAVQEIQLEVVSGHFRWVNDLWIRVQQHIPGSTPDDLPTLLRRYGEESVGFIAARLGAILRHTAEFLFHLSVTILAMFYLYRDGDSLAARMRELLPFELEHRVRMIHEARGLVFASVLSSFVAALFHGVAGGVAFGLTGIHAPIFWGVMMGFFSLVPVVGTALIWAPAAISLMLGGHIVRGVLLIVICGVIVGTADNFIRPWVISGRAEMGGLVVFISVLGGIAVFGMLGVVLGPIVVATAASLLEVYAPSASPGNTAA
jgi:predicted PurR-regulated permease PerM